MSKLKYYDGDSFVELEKEFPDKLPADGGIASALSGVDSRSVNQIPDDYMNAGEYYFGRTSVIPEFKNNSAIGTGISGTYCFLVTFNPWSDKSGGYPFQIAMGESGIKWRVGISGTQWSTWTSM